MRFTIYSILFFAYSVVAVQVDYDRPCVGKQRGSSCTVTLNPCQDNPPCRIGGKEMCVDYDCDNLFANGKCFK